EANPQEILEREEKVTLVPFLIMQGALDDNVLPEFQEKFARTYRAAGGHCDYRLFENSVHEWVAEPGPQTDKAREMGKEFIARQPKAGSRPEPLGVALNRAAASRPCRRGRRSAGDSRRDLRRRSRPTC